MAACSKAEASKRSAALGVGMILALSFRALFHWLSGRLLVRASIRIDRLLSDRVLSAMLERSAARPGEVGSQVLRDLDATRQFATGRTAKAPMEFPWIGQFLGLLFLVDQPWCCPLYRDYRPAGCGKWGRQGVDHRQMISPHFYPPPKPISAVPMQLSMGMMPGVLKRSLCTPCLSAQARASARAVFQCHPGERRVGSQALILGCGAIHVIDATPSLPLADLTSIRCAPSRLADGCREVQSVKDSLRARRCWPKCRAQNP
jgi:hypothetical protein